MSVRATIEVVTPDGSVPAMRLLEIELTSTPVLDEKGWRDLDEIGTYSVIVRRSPTDGRARRAAFEHRYGDDLTILVAKAGEAIRALHGTL
jgi:hypothetical protein